MAERTHRYSQAEKEAAVDLYFSSEEETLRSVVGELGYPSVNVLRMWVSADPRYEGKAPYSSRKEKVIAYCAENPGASYEDVFARFGYPKNAHTLKRWLNPLGWRRRTKGEK